MKWKKKILGFVSNLQSKYTYLDTKNQKIDKSINDVTAELKTTKSIGSGKDSTTRGANIKSTTKNYRTDIQLVYDKSINSMYLVDAQGNVLDSIAKVYTSTKGDETDVGGETPTGDWILDYNTSIKQKTENYKYKDKNINAAALYAIEGSESADTLNNAKRAGINIHYGTTASWSEGCIVMSEENLTKLAKWTNKSNTKVTVID